MFIDFCAFSLRQVHELISDWDTVSVRPNAKSFRANLIFGRMGLMLTPHLHKKVKQNTDQ